MFPNASFPFSLFLSISLSLSLLPSPPPPPPSQGGGGELDFDQFVDSFGDMIDEDGEAVQIPKVVQLKLDAVKDDSRRLTMLLDEEIEKNEGLQAQLASQNGEWQAMLTDTNQEVELIETELHRAHADTAALVKELREQTTEITRQTEKIDLLEEELVAAQHTTTRHQEKAATAESNQDLEVEVDHLKQANEELLAHLETAQREVYLPFRPNLKHVGQRCCACFLALVCLSSLSPGGFLCMHSVLPRL